MNKAKSIQPQEELSESDLQQFISDHKDKIPQTTQKIKTLFDVMKQPHLESVWSNIYAFFFNPYKEHRFGSIPIATLIELIEEKQHGRDLRKMDKEYIRVKCEDSTKEGKRVDIALLSESYAIVIENKVQADLYNNLGVYWNNYPHYDQSHKQGVVLSLHPKTISLANRGEALDHDPQKWINITHIELMDRMSKKLCNVKGSDKYTLLYHEFYQNIKNTTNEMSIDKINFYINNIKEVEQISRLRNNIKKQIASQIRSSQSFKNNGFSKPYELSHCIGTYFHHNKRQNKRENQHLVIGVICENLYTPKQEIVIVIECLTTRFIKEVLDNASTIFTPEEQKHISTSNLKTNEDWAHIAITSKKITPEEFQNISGVVGHLTFQAPINGNDKGITIYTLYKKIKEYYSSHKGGV